LLRVARREGGTRVYAARDTEPAGPQAITAPLDAGTVNSRMDALVDVIARKYAPLPAVTLGRLMSLLCGGAPQWRGQRADALNRAKQRLAHARIEGIDWYWPAVERAASVRWRPDDNVRLLTPFDPIVWDRRRFEIFWNWAYRFEAYTPASKRTLGYYALPLLWRDRVIGWGNLAVKNGKLESQLGYIESHPPRERIFKRELEGELDRVRVFLRLES